MARKKAPSAEPSQNEQVQIRTLGELRESGWESRPVKEELRANAIERIRLGEDLFPGIWGYEDSVIPTLENAILAGHDVIFLGERGQAKTRLMRQLVELLDPHLPIVAGSEINDDPYNPVSKYAKELVAKRGNKTPIEWVVRQDRFAEKLATPDTSIADLIGEVDPIKVAEGRYLSDELTLHYGLVPRANRGIFAMNELPDLAERIQVGLLNVLEERDVQIRGFRVRLPLDILLMASANPEDYTNRGRIITPLKDRFGTQVRTHYPKDTQIEKQIMEQEVRSLASQEIPIRMPDFMADLIATLSQILRDSDAVDQRSGVSVRLSVSNYEILLASAVRRVLDTHDAKAVPRICDLDAILPSMTGKVELETFEEYKEKDILLQHIKSAVRETFSDRLKLNDLKPLLAEFERESELVINTGEDISDGEYLVVVSEIPEFKNALALLGLSEEDQKDASMVASGVEFILEGLHLSQCLNKHSAGRKATYKGYRQENLT